MNDYLKIFIVAVIGGALPVFIKIGLGVIPPQTFILLRYLLALTILLPLFVLKKEKLKDRKKFLIVAIFAYFNIFFAALGIKRTSPVMSQMLYSAVPIITATFTHFFLHERLSKKRVIGIIIGFIGVAIIILAPKLQENGISTGSLLGNIIVCFAIVSYSVYTITSKKIQKENSTLTVMTSLALFTIFIQLFLVPFELSDISFLQNLDAKIIFAILYVGILGTSIYHFMYLNVIKTAGPVTASLVLYLQPIFSAISAVFLIGETFSITFFLGSICVIVGAYLAGKKNKTKN